MNWNALKLFKCIHNDTQIKTKKLTLHLWRIARKQLTILNLVSEELSIYPASPIKSKPS